MFDSPQESFQNLFKSKLKPIFNILKESFANWSISQHFFGGMCPFFSLPCDSLTGDDIVSPLTMICGREGHSESQNQPFHGQLKRGYTYTDVLFHLLCHFLPQSRKISKEVQIGSYFGIFIPQRFVIFKEPLDSIAPRCFGPSVNHFLPSEVHFGNFFLMNYDLESYQH